MNEEEYSYGCNDKLDEEFAEKLAQLIVKQGIYNPLILCGTDCEMECRIFDAIVYRYHGNIIRKTCDNFTKDLIDAVTAGRISEFRTQYREADLLILSQLENISGRETSQQELYFILEGRVQQNRQTVFSCNSSPRDITGIEERILAHLYGGVVLPLDGPGYLLEENAKNQGTPVFVR